MWNYAELVHSAKELGGPEVMVKTILHNGRIEGIIETVIVGATIYAVSLLKGYVNEIINYNENGDEISNRPITNMVNQNNFEEIPIGCRLVVAHIQIVTQVVLCLTINKLYNYLKP